MKRWRFVVLAILVLSPALLGLGCGKKEEKGTSYDELADKKVAAIKRLADEMAKDANGVEARGALEEFRNFPIDTQKNPKQAEEITQV